VKFREEKVVRGLKRRKVGKKLKRKRRMVNTGVFKIN
jgi:hypothetical protein